MQEKVTIASRYRLDARLAEGGMGEVWRAHDTVLGRPVAVKLLHASLANDPKAADRFKREALTAASLAHPHIADVYDYLEAEGRPGIVMELVEGENLAHLLSREGAVPPARAIAIATDVLDALEAAHQAGVVHRDVKPANILLTRAGTVKVADFGIARAMGESSLTATGTIMGTAHYSAPEQLRGEPSTPQTDLYALGIVLYEMLAGTRPFQGETPIAIATARLAEDPPPLRSIRPSVPIALAAVVERAMARDPAQRFASADEMRRALTGEITTDVLPVIGSDPTIGFPALHAHEEAADDETHDRADLAWHQRSGYRILIGLGILALLIISVPALTRGEVTVAVPALTGRPIAEAKEMAEKLGLSIETTSADSAQPKGTVLRQDIAPGVEVKAESTTITLAVSDGTPRCCPVPQVVGMSLEEAQRAIEAAELTVGTIVARLRSGEPDGTIVDQNPRADIRRSPGDPVDLTVARDAPAEEDDDSKRGRGKRKDDD